jgi:hypothetical protein
LKSTNATAAAAIGGVLLAFVLLALALLAGATTGGATTSGAAPGADRPRPAPLRPAPTAEPLVPTALPAFRQPAVTAARPTATVTAPRTAAPPVEATAAATVTGSAAAGPGFPFGGPPRGRAGVGFPIGTVADYDFGEGPPGWWLIWHVEPEPPQVGDTRFVQMVRFQADGYRPTREIIEKTARANPGSLWLLGNEPDVAWQDNATAEQYAATYGKLYPIIKAADPTALVAIAGVSQSTPLRLAYLDDILAAYWAQYGAEMPVDVWNVHAFILREEQGSWGVGIPPGMAEQQGQLWEIDDHADMEILKQQVVDFRRWMAERGFRDKPLIISEYGILMPESYGFPPDTVATFLADSFDYLLTATDPETGYAPDENRLVQAFCWYSAADTVYPTSNLFDPATKAITAVGEMFTAYVAGLPPGK